MSDERLETIARKVGNIHAEQLLRRMLDSGMPMSEQARFLNVMSKLSWMDVSILAALREAVAESEAQVKRLIMELKSARGTLEMSHIFTVHRNIGRAIDES